MKISCSKATLRQKILALGVQDRIRLLGFREDIPLLMRFGRGGALLGGDRAALLRGRGNMLTGKPLVARKAGGVMQITEHGMTGFISELGCVAGLAEAVGIALAAAQAVAAAGHELARGPFAVEAMDREIHGASSGS